MVLLKMAMAWSTDHPDEPCACVALDGVVWQVLFANPTSTGSAGDADKGKNDEGHQEAPRHDESHEGHEKHEGHEEHESHNEKTQAQG